MAAEDKKMLPLAFVLWKLDRERNLVSGRENRGTDSQKNNTTESETERETHIFLTTDAYVLRQNAQGGNINAAVQSLSCLLSFSI